MKREQLRVGQTTTRFVCRSVIREDSESAYTPCYLAATLQSDWSRFRHDFDTFGHVSHAECNDVTALHAKTLDIKLAEPEVPWLSL